MYGFGSIVKKRPKNGKVYFRNTGLTKDAICLAKYCMTKPTVHKHRNYFDRKEENGVRIYVPLRQIKSEILKKKYLYVGNCMLS